MQPKFVGIKMRPLIDGSENLGVINDEFVRMSGMTPAIGRRGVELSRMAADAIVRLQSIEDPEMAVETFSEIDRLVAEIGRELVEK